MADGSEVVRSDAGRRRVTESHADGLLGQVPDVDADQRSLLLQAVTISNPGLVQRALELGSDPSAKGEDGCGAAQLAVQELNLNPRELKSIKCGASPVGSSESDQYCKDTANSLLAFELASLKDSIHTSIRSEVTTLGVSLATEINALKQSIINERNEQADVVSTVFKLQQSMFDLRNAQDNAIFSLSKQMDTIPKSMEVIRSYLNSLHNTFESKLTSMTAELRNVMEVRTTPMDKIPTTELVTSNQTTSDDSAEKPHIPTIKPSDGKNLKDQCIKEIMWKTEVIPWSEENIGKMKRRYELTYDEDPITSSILEFLRFQSSVEVLVDFETDRIGRLKPTLRDHEGRERSGSEFYSFADFEERRVYVDGYWSEERDAVKYLVQALSQLSVCMAFHNNGLPYSKGVKEEKRFKEILAEAEEVKNGSEVELDWDIANALSGPTQLSREISLASAVPSMIVQHGSSLGRSRLRRQLPSLLEYYEEHVVTTLSRETNIKIECERE